MRNGKGIPTGIFYTLILIHEKAPIQTRAMGRMCQGLGKVPPSMQDRAKALASPLHPAQRPHFSSPVWRPVFCQLYLLFQGEALAINGSRAGVGGQHRDWHMGNSGTELTLHVAGTGRGLKAGTQGIATTWPPPLPWASLCVEQKLCM